MGNAAQPFDESLITRLFVDVADETAVYFKVIEADVVQAANFTELAAEVFDAEAAAEGAQGVAESAEFVKVAEGANFGNFQPQARGKVFAVGDQVLQAERKSKLESGEEGGRINY